MPNADITGSQKKAKFCPGFALIQHDEIPFIADEHNFHNFVN